MNPFASLEPRLDQLQRRSLRLGIVALAVGAVGGFWNPTQFFRSYLVAYLFWVGLALGSIAVVMLHHMVGGGWGFVIRRPLESATRTFRWLAVLFVPLLFGLPHLYPWARPEAVAADAMLHYKHRYLNPPLFIARSVVYFVAWILLAHFLNKWSFEQDDRANHALNRRLEGLSGPGLVIYGLTVTYSSVDWAMSLEPHWFSTIYGMIFMVVQSLAAMAFVIVVVMLLAEYRPLADVLQPAHFQDLGNLLLTFVMLWAYLSFSQFLIIWSGNLQEEIPWYLSRGTGQWAMLAVVLIVCHFGVPFFLLLLRSVKRRAHMLAAVAAGLLLMSLADLYWLVVPAFQPSGPRLHWLDVVAPIGIGGVWISVFVSGLKGKPLLPLHDPRFEELVGHAG